MAHRTRRLERPRQAVTTHLQKLWLGLAILLAGSPRVLRADTAASVQLELNQAGRDLANELHLDLGQLEQAMQNGVQRAMGLVSIEDFLREFSNATSFSNRGLGADYASNSESGVIGLGGNLALATNFASDVPSAGAAANIAVMAGLNLRPWGHPELMLYGNLFWRSLSINNNMTGSLMSGGAHLQYKMLAPDDNWKRFAIQWGGFDLTTGFEVVRWDASLDGRLSTGFEVQDAMTGTTAGMAASLGGRFGLSSETTTIPIEITTKLRMLYLATLYLGVGTAIQLGSSTIDAGVDGEITRTRGGVSETVAAIRVAAAGTQGPSAIRNHALLGVQANLWRIALFAQATVEPFDRVSVALGLRIVL